MVILVTNDDGIQAPALRALKSALADLGRVVIVAPDRDQSATSHALTLYRPFRIERPEPDVYAVDGTPTDCVIVATHGLIDEAPGLVVSGINHGPNMGEDVLYSGTVAAAMEGLAAGIPSVAVSFGSFDLEYLDSYRDRLKRLIEGIVRVKNFPKDTLLNVNLPPIAGSDVKGIRVTHLGSRVFHEEIARMKDPWGRDIFWIGGGHVTWSGGEESDVRATHEGYISVTPLHVDMTNYDLLEAVRSWNLGA